MSTTRDPVLSPAEVAAELHVHVQTVRTHMRAGVLRSVKRGGRRFIRRSWLDAYLDDGHDHPTRATA